MAKNYKSVEYSSTAFETKTYYKKQKFTNADEGISSIQFRSESLVFNDDSGPISYTTSGSHYNFLNNFLFDPTSFTDGYEKIFTNKFHSSGSVIYIPQQYYGQQIKVNSFKLTDDSNSKSVVIRDDGKGNLYSTNAQASRSAASAASSSENYVGNIHYQAGIVMITETGSWSGSGTTAEDIMYTDVGTGTYKVEFQSTMPIHQNEIVCNISKNEFTATANNSVWSDTGVLQPKISSSLNVWTPYATGIAFYDRPPNVFSQNKIIDRVYDIVPGENSIEWLSETLEINTSNIPAGITRIIGPYSSATQYVEQEGGWVGSLKYLEYDTPYTLNNSLEDNIAWAVQISANGGVPLIVANFPRAVKIDKESDLTIIIRYDT